MLPRIEPNSSNDLPYHDSEINRSIGPINGDFMCLDDAGPLLTAIDKARAQGHVALLDAGCGTGYGLMDMKDQISFLAPIDEDAIEAVGVSLTDFRTYLRGGWREKAHLTDGYIALRIGNLATMSLAPEHFDVAYSYQVLLHNTDATLIIKNVMSSLRDGGVFYFDSLVEQQEKLDKLTDSLDPAEWRIQSESLTRQFIGWQDTRMMHKILRASQTS